MQVPHAGETVATQHAIVPWEGQAAWAQLTGSAAEAASPTTTCSGQINQGSGCRSPIHSWRLTLRSDNCWTSTIRCHTLCALFAARQWQYWVEGVSLLRLLSTCLSHLYAHAPSTCSHFPLTTSKCHLPCRSIAAYKPSVMTLPAP